MLYATLSSATPLSTSAPECSVSPVLIVQSTVMRRWDGTRIWYPNSKLGAMPLLNMSRSDAKVELFKVRNLDLFLGATLMQQIKFACIPLAVFRKPFEALQMFHLLEL